MVLKQLILKVKNNKCIFFEAETNAEIFRLLKEREYDMAILDIHLEDGLSLPLLPEIKSAHPGLKILFFSISPEDLYAQRLIQMGADGFVNKRASEAEICEAISIILSGRRYLSPDFLYTVMMNPEAEMKDRGNPFIQLSVREFEVVTLMLNGKSNKEISALIRLSASTISSHKARIFAKLKVANDIELSQLANTFGLIP